MVCQLARGSVSHVHFCGLIPLSGKSTEKLVLIEKELTCCHNDTADQMAVVKLSGVIGKNEGGKKPWINMIQ